MKPLNFNDLLRRADDIADLNAKELYLHEARTNYQQTVLDAEHFLKKIKSAIALNQKRKELSVPFAPFPNAEQSKSNILKVSTCLIFELLKLVGKGRNFNDLTTLAKFASFITGFSATSILNTMQAGFYFTKTHHCTIIKEVNEVLNQLALPFVIDISQKY
jgi:hypothetical protein